ncbi:hypothetical protein MGWOODY_Smn3497 [hydrothermal vent metagenome]|uniref:Uncharacterized protein n=1 Tax=hydrothermal vent metagenome TaxID=652676 RepID=A0A160TKS3_9ZZZZ
MAGMRIGRCGGFRRHVVPRMGIAFGTVHTMPRMGIGRVLL